MTSAKGAAARGTFRVVRAGGWLRNALASLLGLPRPGSDVPIQLHVTVEGERERWVRDFGGHRVVTVQWAHGDVLMESSGWTSLAAELVIDGSRLRYVFRRAWFAGIPIRADCLLRSRALWRPAETGWSVLVRLSLPMLGELIRYEGWIEPE